MSLPPRWQALREFFEVVQAPLLYLESPGRFIVEANGPDGKEWNDLRPRSIDLACAEPALEATRAVARLCGAHAGLAEPGPECQQGRALYYVPASFLRGRRKDCNVHALSALVLDIDDRDHAGRTGSLAAQRRVPPPTCLVHSGGGVQSIYALREALLFDRTDPAELERAAREYLKVALALQAITGADPTHWPSHLFRCPCTYHIKDPEQPVLVRADIERDRTFNLTDFDAFTAVIEDSALDRACAGLLASLTGERRKEVQHVLPLDATAGPDGKRRVTLPRRVSPHMVRLLNGGGHPKYTRPDGTLDRSRAVYAAATSLLAARIPPEKVVAMLSASALGPAVDDRGEYGNEWLGNQVQKAKGYLDGKKDDARKESPRGRAS